MIALALVMIILKVTLAANKITEYEIKCSRNHDCNNSEDIPNLCRCDEQCFLYGDCCPNAPYISESHVPEFVCSTLGIYMISQCPNATASEVSKVMCESEISAREISLSIPVIDKLTGFTYKNYYCADCNGVDEDKVIFWNASFICPTIPIYLDLNNLAETPEFNQDKGQWVISEKRSDKNISYPCYLRPERPWTSESIRSCKPGLIDSCSDNWDDMEVEEKCHKFYAPVFRSGTSRYRNIYCAICNNVSLSEIRCFDFLFRTLSGGGFGPSFRILLDVNSVEGEPKCKVNEVLFNDKCRELTCGSPRLIRRNGKCVPRDRGDYDDE